MTEIRATHPFAFRWGQWARIVTTDTVTVGMPFPRRCYLVSFPDGVTDLWPVDDPAAGYQFRELSGAA